MDHSQKPDDLPKQLVENVASGGDGSAFKEQISSMSNAERLKLVQDLNSSVLDANIANPGNRIILDVRLDNKDGNVKDIDLVRQAPPNSDGQKLNRIDLYDSGDAAGQDADEKQRLDAVTAPYEQLYYGTIANMTRQEDLIGNYGSQQERESFKNMTLGNTVDRMLQDVKDPEEREKLRANMLHNIDKIPDGQTTALTRPMDDLDSLESRHEKEPPRDVQQRIEANIKLGSQLDRELSRRAPYLFPSDDALWPTEEE